MDRSTLMANAVIQPLTQHEIDRRIGDVASRVLARPVDDASATDSAERHPRWISAAELVQRMQPFMVLN